MGLFPLCPLSTYLGMIRDHYSQYSFGTRQPTCRPYPRSALCRTSIASQDSQCGHKYASFTILVAAPVLTTPLVTPGAALIPLIRPGYGLCTSVLKKLHFVKGYFETQFFDALLLTSSSMSMYLCTTWHVTVSFYYKIGSHLLYRLVLSVPKCACAVAFSTVVVHL